MNFTKALLPASPAALLRIAILAGAVLLTGWAQWTAGSALPRVGDEWLRDRFITLQTSAEPESRILVVDIDEATLASYPWPWTRARQAELVERLVQQQPRGIALDIVMFKPGDAGRRCAHGHAGRTWPRCFGATVRLQHAVRTIAIRPTGRRRGRARRQRRARNRLPGQPCRAGARGACRQHRRDSRPRRQPAPDTDADLVRRTQLSDPGAGVAAVLQRRRRFPLPIA